MGEFKPTNQTSLDLDRAILGLKHKKDAIVAKKIEARLKLGDLRDQRDGMNIHSSEAVAITAERKTIKKKVYDWELEIKDINGERKNKLMLLTEVNNFLKSGEKDDKMVVKLEQLRLKYLDFAGDNTRVSSMRIMANKIADELETIIKY